MDALNRIYMRSNDRAEDLEKQRANQSDGAGEEAGRKSNVARSTVVIVEGGRGGVVGGGSAVGGSSTSSSSASAIGRNQYETSGNIEHTYLAPPVARVPVPVVWLPEAVVLAVSVAAPAVMLNSVD